MSQKVSYRKKVFKMDWEWSNILDTLPDVMKKKFYSLSPKMQRVEFSGFNMIVNMIAK